MARLPDVMDLGAPVVPRRASGIVSDQSAQIQAEAVGNFAGSIGNIAQQFGEREDKFAYASAKSSLLEADLATRKSLENDPDWGSYETKYNEAMTKSIGNASKMIRGNRDRALFQMDAKLDAERGAQEVRAKAKSKEIDWGRSDTDTTLEALRNSAISADDQATSEQALMAAKDKIVGAKDRGYYTEQEATNAFQTFRDSFAVGKLETMPPDKRVALLNDDKSVARFLQPDVRAKLLKQAETENHVSHDEATAQVYADDAISKGLTFTDALAGTAKYSGTTREAANREIRQRFADIQSAKAMDVKAISTSAWSTVMQSGSMPPTKQLLELRDKAPEEERQMRDYLLAKSRQARADAEKGPVTDEHEYHGLRELARNNPSAFAQLDLERYQPYLSNADAHGLLNIQSAISKSDAKEMESQRVLNSALAATKLDAEAAGINLKPKPDNLVAVKKAELFTNALSRALDTATEAKGSPLKNEEARQISNDMLRQYVLQNSGFIGIGKTTKLKYQMTAGEYKDAGDNKTPRFVSKLFSDIPTTVRDDLVRTYRSQHPGMRPLTSDDEAAIERMYTRGIDTGLIK